MLIQQVSEFSELIGEYGQKLAKRFRCRNHSLSAKYRRSSSSRVPVTVRQEEATPVEPEAPKGPRHGPLEELFADNGARHQNSDGA